MSKKTDKKQKTEPDILPAMTEERAVKPVAQTVTELSFQTGNRLKMNGHNPANEVGPGPMHRAADLLHGWTWHEHNYAKPVRLSTEDYLAAIEAAGSFKRHPAAIAPQFKPPAKE